MTWDDDKLAKLSRASRRTTGRLPADKSDFVLPEDSRLKIDADRITTTASHPLRTSARIAALGSWLIALGIGLFLLWTPADPGPRPETCGQRVGRCQDLFPEKTRLPTPSQIERAVTGSLYAQILNGETTLTDPMEPDGPFPARPGLSQWDSKRFDNYMHWEDHPNPDELLPQLSKQQRAFVTSSHAGPIARKSVMEFERLVCQITHCRGKDPAMKVWELRARHHAWSAYGGGRIRPFAIAGVAGCFVLLGWVGWFWRARTHLVLYTARLVWNGRSIPIPHIDQVRWTGRRLWLKLRTGEVLRSTLGMRQTDGEMVCHILQGHRVDDAEADSDAAAQREAEAALGRIQTAVKTRPR